MKLDGVAFELFEVAVVGSGVAFARIRHERDGGLLRATESTKTRGR